MLKVFESILFCLFYFLFVLLLLSFVRKEKDITIKGVKLMMIVSMIPFIYLLAVIISRITTELLLSSLLLL